MFDVEETMKFLLKGVADSSDVNDIKKKVMEVYNEGRVLNIKLGLDPSAPDIHLGHAVVLRKIRQLQELGHRATIIIGDFTGMIGDPTGKSKTRNQLTKLQVEENAKTYQEQIFKIIDRNKTDLRYNSEWFDKMNFRDVIELCSKTTVARILERDDFQNRYNAQKPIALDEFFYPLMQAYDSVAIKADIELGGTDQVFNIMMGRNIQKDYGITPQIALFMPLLEGIDGKEKMSKSLGNYIGINESAYDMYVKIMKIPDNLIIKYYNLTTDLHPDKIKVINDLLEKGLVNPRDIKMRLARDIIILYHTKDELELAEKKYISIYQKQEIFDDFNIINIDNDSEVLSLIECIFRTGKYKTKSDVRRLIQQGAVKINGVKTMDIYCTLENNDIIQVGKGNLFKISLNKNNLLKK